MNSLRTARYTLMVVCFLAMVLLFSIALAGVKTSSPSTTLNPVCTGACR